MLIRLVYVLLPMFLFSKQTICLNMIVKNESKVIERCLDSVKGLIDHWVIVDTGSIDGTQEIIQKCLKDLPGELYERPWIDFAFNRNEALALAKGKSPYILIMDADDWLELTPNSSLPLLSDGAYQIWCGTESFSFLKPQIIKGDLAWSWIGKLHEYLACSQPFSAAVLDCVRYRTGGDGGRSRDGEKYLRAIEILKEAIAQEPTNERYVFYLAESYRDAGLKGYAIEFYLKRIDMKGWDEEVFWSMLQVAMILQELKLPWSSLEDLYLRAHLFRPHRCEPIYFLAVGFNRQQDYKAAYEILKKIGSTRKDKLFNFAWIEDYGLLFQFSICAYHLGYYQEALDACDTLLANDRLPIVYRDQVKINRAFSFEAYQKTP